MKKLEFAHLKIDNRIANITISRAKKRNALNAQVVQDLIDLFNFAEASEDVKIIVLKAEGDAFCAGADLAYLQSLQSNTFEENLADSKHLKNLFEKIYLNKKIIIAQVEGHAIAGGGGLACVCDFVFAVPEAKFGFTEVKIGFVPAIISTFILRKIGEMRTKELLLTGDLITANKAKAIQLINYISDKDNIEDDVQTFSEKIINSCSDEALSVTKNLISNVFSMNIEEALNYSSEGNAKARASKDCKRGISAFLNKTDINW